MSVARPVHAGLFSEGATPRLLGGRCGDCGHHHFPRHDVCPYCASDATEDASLSPTGRLWAWTAVTHPPPGYIGTVPYGFGVVELPEGIRVVTRLTESDPAKLRVDQAMHLVVDVLATGTGTDADDDPDDAGADVVTYAFAPDEKPAS